MHRRVVKTVAQNRPQEAALRTFGFTQQPQALSGWLFEHAAIHLIALLATGHIVLALGIEVQDVAPGLLVKTGAGLLAKMTLVEQSLQHRGRAEAAVERVGLFAQVVLQRPDHMGHGVQAHHVGGAEGARAGAAQLLARQVIDHVVG